ncbi:MAG: glycosyltransferase family 4 protein [Gaiellaceae bacterium]|jgi:phosphatidylinositol alpha-mannosyltransferase
MKVGIVVPYSWSYWGGVLEHAHHQAAALRELGVETRTIVGNDPPGPLTRILHPRSGRHDPKPEGVIPVGRSVIVPANASLPNIILTPGVYPRIKRALENERFDLIHVHEPMTPAIAVIALALARCTTVATFHASGNLGWMRGGKPLWGFLMERLDARIAVSEQARASAARWLPGHYEIVPNGIVIPDRVDAGGREEKIVFIGRHDPRKGLLTLLSAWPEIRRRTGATLKVIGADPLSVRLLMTRHRLREDGLELPGFLSEEQLTAEISSAKMLVAPSLSGESFGMVLTRAYASSTPVVASDIPGYRDVFDGSAGVAVPPGDVEALQQAVIGLFENEPRRRRMGEAARKIAVERYDWRDIAARLLSIYELAIEGRFDTETAAVEA